MWEKRQRNIYSKLPREVLKSVKRKKVRGRIQYFLMKSVTVSSVLFTVDISCELWIVKLAREEESFLLDFFKTKFEQEKCWSSGRNYKCYPEFLSEFSLITRITSCQKSIFCYLETLN